MPIEHLFQSAKSDSADATLIRASDWNADHVVVGGGPWLADIHATTTVTLTIAETTLFTYTVLANTAQVGNVYRLTAWGRYFNNTGSAQTVVWRLKFGATTMHQTPAISYGTHANQRAWRVTFEMVIESATAERSVATMLGTATGVDGAGWAALGTSESQIGYGSAAEAINANKAIALTAQPGANTAGLTMDIRGALLERIAA